jgi:AcrR family transcriptional regulator
MAELSRMVGVSVAAPYKHFADKDELLLVLAVRGARDRRNRFIAAMDAQPDPAGKLVALTVELVRYAEEEPALFDLILIPGLSREVSAEVTRLNFEVFETVTEGIRPLFPDVQERFGLIQRATAAAHGIALFRKLNMWVGSEGEDQVVRTTRALIAEALANGAGAPTNAVPGPTGAWDFTRDPR